MPRQTRYNCVSLSHLHSFRYGPLLFFWFGSYQDRAWLVLCFCFFWLKADFMLHPEQFTIHSRSSRIHLCDLSSLTYYFIFMTCVYDAPQCGLL